MTSNKPNNVLWTSPLTPAHYVADFALEIPSLRARWAFSNATSNSIDVRLPNKATITFSIHLSDLAREEPEEFQTTMLWKHSLAMLPVLAEDVEELDLIDNLLKGYSAFLETDSWLSLAAQMTSLDHCVATRIRSLAALSAIYTLNDQTLPISAIEILKKNLDWASEPSHYAPNNHGLMLAISVFHASEIFPELVDADTRILAQEKFSTILRSAFDGVWACTENTPEYHAFYITLCSKVIEFLTATASEDHELLILLEDLVQHTTKSLEQTVWTNDAFPPLGDSGTIGPSNIRSRDGFFFSPQTGLFIEKDSGVFRSLKCGYASYVHKHMDDTSLTLVIDGEELLIDAGLHNYDWNDPITRAIKSQRGHSGFYFPDFDHFYPSTIYRPERYRVESSLAMSTSADPFTRLSARYTFDQTHTVSRQVTLSAGQIDIVDRYWIRGTDDVGAPPVQRFLVPADAKRLSFSPGHLLFTTERLWMEIEFSPTRAVVEHIGTEGELPRGWMSRSWSSAAPCRSIDIAAARQSMPSTAKIRYGRISEGSIPTPADR